MTTINTTKFITHLQNALVEKDVENAYRELLKLGIPDSIITSPYGGDGVLKSKQHKLFMLLEFKYNFDFKKRNDVVQVIIQSLYYLKKAEDAGDRVPQLLFVGDKDECFVIHTNSLVSYLDYNTDWTIAPSSAHLNNSDLMLELYNDNNVNPFIFEVDKDFDFSEVVNKIIDFGNDTVRLIRITEKNIDKIFTYFCDRVIPNSKIETNSKVGLFINVLTNPNENYIHPKKKNTLITPNGEVNINGDYFVSFFSHFDREYKPSEKEKLISIADRLIEDNKRRIDGAFFTPTAWVDEAHKMIAERFGNNWKDEYVVIDNCSGTGNLTRDYKFKELYSSTLIKDEVDIMIQNNINPEATRFQYDFLNSDIVDEENLPDGMIEAFKQNKKIIFFINPPYGTGKNMSQQVEDKAGIADTEVNKIMLNDNIGACSQNLYAQFLYKINKIKEYYNLTECNIALFSPSLFLTGGSYQGLRTLMFNNFKLNTGMLFQASHFADVDNNWGILFSIWNTGKHTDNQFTIELKDVVIDKEF